MKYLSEYVEETTKGLLEKHGAFYAFSNEQLAENQAKGVEYCNMGAGMIAPVDNAKDLRMALNSAYEKAVQMDIEENGKEAIIKREIWNHECGFTWYIDDAVSAVEIHGYSHDDVAFIFNQMADSGAFADI